MSDEVEERLDGDAEFPEPDWDDVREAREEVRRDRRERLEDDDL